MFDMSWGEIMVIGGVALIVIGPKDLPKALRTVGQMTTKVRRLAGEFQSQFSEAMREAELESVKKEVDGLKAGVAAATTTAFNPLQTIRDELKSSVEARPVAAGASQPEVFGANPGPLAAQDEAAGLPPRVEPLPAADLAAAIPEVQPLVPLPIDGPVIPVSPVPGEGAALDEAGRSRAPTP